MAEPHRHREIAGIELNDEGTVTEGSLISYNATNRTWSLRALLTAIAHAMDSTAHTAGTLGDLIYGGAAGVWTRLAGNTTATKKFLRQTGTGTVSAAPAWDTVVTADLADLFDATVPAAVGTAAVGVAATAPRRDHVHPTGAGTPSTQAFGDAAAIGTGPAAAMTDHKHAMPVSPPIVFARSGSTITVANTATLTNLFDVTLTGLPTRTAGSIVRFRVYGDILYNNNVADSFTLGYLVTGFGGIQVASIKPNNGVLSATRWAFEAELVFIKNGTSDFQWLKFLSDNAGDILGTANSDSFIRNTSSAALVATDDVALSITWSTGSANNSVRMFGYQIEVW